MIPDITTSNDFLLFHITINEFTNKTKFTELAFATFLSLVVSTRWWWTADSGLAMARAWLHSTKPAADRVPACQAGAWHGASGWLSQLNNLFPAPTLLFSMTSSILRVRIWLEGGAIDPLLLM